MVTRRSRLLAGAATALVAGLVTLLGPSTPPASAAPDDYDAPLEMTIDRLTPGALPRTGPLRVSGTITNVDLETWRDVRIYPMFGAGPGCSTCAEVMTTAAELELAADSDPAAPVGERYVDDPAVRDDIAALAPGQTLTYEIRIPQRVLRQLFPRPTAGVYWFGVHALGSSPSSPSDEFADGRARTFLPSFPAAGDGADAGDAEVDTAVVVPLRGRIAHAADGELGRTATWEQELGQDGSLGGPLAFGAAAGDTPLTWLLDPALPDAVRQLAQGNPTRRVAPVLPEEEPSSDESPGAEESDDGEEPEEEPEGPGTPTLDEDSTVITAAERWLGQAETALPGGAVALLPYGDVDVAAAATGLPTLYPDARDQVSGVLEDWGVSGRPVVGAPNGYLDALGIESVDDGAAVLLGDQMFPTETFSGRPPVGGLVGDRPLVVTSTAAARGGPGPDPQQAPVALRQRILSEALVRLLRAGDDSPEPLVVVLPTGIDPAGAEDFWAGLDVDGVRPVDLDTVLARGTYGRSERDRQIDASALSYPAGQEEAELPASVLAEASQLIRSARTLQGLLGETFTIGDTLLGEALAGTSYAVRDDPDAGPRLDRSRAWVDELLGSVTIDAPQGVTLSSTSGSFNVAVSNTLDFPVTVRIEASTEGGASIEAANPIVLAANSRSSVAIRADTAGPGVHNVRLRLTDSEGHPIGAEDSLPVRAGSVGVVIWVIIGSGVGILFVAIGIRLARRIRKARATGDADRPEEAEAVS